jgi:TonB family protein
MTEANEILPHFLRPKMAEQKPAEKKRLIIAGTSAVLVVALAAAVIPVLGHRTASSVKPVTTPEPTVTVNHQPEDATLKPTLSTPTVPAPTEPAAAVRDAQHSLGAESTSDRENAGPSRAQAQIMNDQLNAPARIHVAATPAEQAPPPSGGFAAADMYGSGNNSAIRSVFNSASQPVVGAASPEVINVSSGITSGLLILKRPPVYPSIARAARVSGTVVLAATISKTGTIKNLQVVSGPEMLRESAVDAVRAWRYKPYKLDNRPTEVDTTINVTFSLDN